MNLLFFQFNPHSLTFIISSLYLWSIHPSVLIVRYSGIATNHLPCIALEDTLLPASAAKTGLLTLWKKKVVLLLKLLFFGTTILLTLRALLNIPFPSNTSLNPGYLVPAFTKLSNLVLFNMYVFSSSISFHPFPFFLLLLSFKSLLQHIQMIIKSFTAILAVILEAFGVYCEGEFKLGCG
jgi:hypothetical protein